MMKKKNSGRRGDRVCGSLHDPPPRTAQTAAPPLRSTRTASATPVIRRWRKRRRRHPQGGKGRRAKRSAGPPSSLRKPGLRDGLLSYYYRLHSSSRAIVLKDNQRYYSMKSVRKKCGAPRDRKTTSSRNLVLGFLGFLRRISRVKSSSMS